MRYFLNYGRILSEYVYLKNFREGNLRKYVNIEGNNYLSEIKEKIKRWYLFLVILIILNYGNVYWTMLVYSIALMIDQRVSQGEKCSFFGKDALPLQYQHNL